MGIFNNISKLSKSNIKTGDTLIGIIWSDYAKKDDLLNYYNKSMPIVTTNPIDMGENRITSLGDPTEDTDGVNKSFLNKKNLYSHKKIKK